MKVTGHVSSFHFSRGRWQKDFQEALVDAVHEALKDFLEAAAPRVPVRTGMARGSLGPLAQFLGLELDLSGAIPEKRDNPQAGAALTTPASELVTFDERGFHFKMEIGTEHYNALETGHGNPNFNYQIQPPWLSLTVGKAAFREKVKEKLKERMPRLKKYLLRVNVPLREA